MAYKYDSIPALFTAICDAIRSKTGGTDPIPHQDIPEQIESIETGGGTDYLEVRADGTKVSDYPRAYEYSNNTLTTIGQYAFAQSGLTKLTLPAATFIDSYACDNCQLLTAISLPALVSLGTGSFRNCKALTSVNLPLWAPAETGKSSYAFQSCTRITSVTLPAATVIPQYAFDGCSALAEINAPAVRTLGPAALQHAAITDFDETVFPALEIVGASALASTKIGTAEHAKIKEVGGTAFASCTRLTSVKLPALESIVSAWAWRGCTALTRVDLGASGVTAPTIQANTFASCTEMDTLILRYDSVAALAATSALAFAKSKFSYSTGYIYVPAALIEEYKAATNWSTFAAKFRAIEDYPDICDPEED